MKRGHWDDEVNKQQVWLNKRQSRRCLTLVSGAFPWRCRSATNTVIGLAADGAVIFDVFHLHIVYTFVLKIERNVKFSLCFSIYSSAIANANNVITLLMLDFGFLENLRNAIVVGARATIMMAVPQYNQPKETKLIK